jgi:hypothetical protein
MRVGSALFDIPSQDEESFNDLIIKIDSKMTNKRKPKNMVYYLEHKDELARIANGSNGVKIYATILYEQLLSNLKQLRIKPIRFLYSQKI